MPRDYVHRAQSQKNTPRPFPWRTFFVLMIILPPFVYGLFLLKKHHAQFALSHHQALVQKAHTVQSSKSNDSKEARATSKTDDHVSTPLKFEFYNMLPKQTVDVSDVKEEQSALVATTHTPKTELTTQYLLQVASLTHLDEVKALQHKIMVLGITTHVLPIQRGDIQWYRVQVGPLRDYAAAHKAHDALQKHDINSIVLTVRSR